MKVIQLPSDAPKHAALTGSAPGGIGSTLVSRPRFMVPIWASAKRLLIADPAAEQLNRVPDSVDTLEPQRPLCMRPTVEIDEANFEPEVLKSSQAVLVESATGWNLPSILLDGLMDEIATEFVDHQPPVPVRDNR
jgi:hypothetical protein